MSEFKAFRRLIYGIVAFLLVFALLAGSFILRDHAVQAQAPSGTGGQYCYINTATTTACRNGFGYLTLVSVNGGTTGVVTLYDIASSGCTGTPASGKFATILAATAPVTMTYSISVKNGICVVTAAATDVTVSYN
jgi:hypothetical protein